MGRATGMQGMQKHSGICLFLTSSEFEHNTGENAILSINAYLGATLPMRDSVLSPIFSAKRWLVPHTSARNSMRLVLFKPLARKFFHCRGQLTAGQLTGLTSHLHDLLHVFFIPSLANRARLLVTLSLILRIRSGYLSASIDEAGSCLCS